MWDKLTPEARDYIKNTVLGLLAHNDSQVVKSGALCISSIATIELPKN